MDHHTCSICCVAGKGSEGAPKPLATRPCRSLLGLSAAFHVPIIWWHQWWHHFNSLSDIASQRTICHQQSKSKGENVYQRMIALYGIEVSFFHSLQYSFLCITRIQHSVYIVPLVSPLLFLNKIKICMIWWWWYRRRCFILASRNNTTMYKAVCNGRVQVRVICTKHEGGD